MRKIWFTSDTHFGSQRTLELSKRPFKTVEEMDKTLIDNWNSVVGDDDIVFHLGDFGNYEIAKQLNGWINLLQGNYERIDNSFKDFENYFNLVYNVNKNSIWMEHLVDNFTHRYKISMTHEPSFVKDIEIKNNHINLFGHVHKLCMVKSYGLNVGTDCHNFYPIDLETVLFYHNAILNHYDDEVFN